MLWLLSFLFQVFVYVVVGVGIGNKILQVCLDSGQNRLSKKISYVYLGGQVEQFLCQEFQGPSLNISIHTYIGRQLPDRKGQVPTCSRIKGKTCGISPPIYGQIEVENLSKQKKRQEKGKPGHVVQIRLLCIRGITFTANGRFKLRISPNRRYKQIKTVQNNSYG